MYVEVMEVTSEEKMIVDRFHCAEQDLEAFSFEGCYQCRFLEIDKGKRLRVSCRKLKNTEEKLSFEAAILLHNLGLPYQVEILSSTKT